MSEGWDWELTSACLYGSIKLVRLMIEQGNNYWNCGLVCACEGGHMEIVRLMIEHGANNWNRGLANASMGGYKEIALLMIKKGAYINHCRIKLEYNDITYLIKTGVKNFGIYMEQAAQCRIDIENIRKVLEKFLIKDLTYIVSGY